MNLKIKTALVSVSDKEGLKSLLKIFKKYQIKIISSGGTYKTIKKLGYECVELSNYTGFKEMLDGRVKTINPLIYSSLLYKRENEFHKKQFLSLKIPEIDIVIVNLYPFHKYLKKKGTNNIVDMIDIGGPSLLRASAKNFKYITPIIDKKDYEKLISNLKKNDGKTDLSFRKKMAGKIYKATSSYDKIISNWFNDN